MNQIRKVLVAVDGSDCSRAALVFACTMASKLGVSVEVLTVVDAPANAGGSEVVAAREELHRLVKSVPHDALTLLERLDFGDARERIVATAEREHFDLIVLGTHGRTGRPRSLAGSVAESVVRTAHCPVLTVRG